MRPHGNTNEGPLVCRGRSYPTTPPNPAIRVGAINPKFLAKKYFSATAALTPTTLIAHLTLGKRNSQGAPGRRITTRPPGTLAILKKNFLGSLTQLTPHAGPAATRFRLRGVLDPNSLAHHRYPAG